MGVLEVLNKLNKESGRNFGPYLILEMARVGQNNALHASLIFELIANISVPDPERINKSLAIIEESGIGLSIARDIAQTSRIKTLLSAALFIRENAPINVASATKFVDRPTLPNLRPYIVRPDNTLELHSDVYQLLVPSMPLALAKLGQFSPEMVSNSRALT